ncbi:MAG: PEGA domain-containing protein, partial [Proteobacteria bacterium]
MSQQMEQFGKYLLLEKLATGGMAEVYLAKSVGAVGVNKFVAIKRILPQFSQSQEYIDMFKEEAKIAVNLNHGNVVSIYDFGVEHNQFFLVMEYVEGRNLRQIVNEMKKSNVQFSTDQIVFIAKEVAAGLDHAHRCIDGSTGRPLNITHRDMSPQNIMVSFEGETKIIDFGIAKSETQIEATKAGKLKGKFGYMSPEQSDGLPIDLRTDIFSLGICLWEMLANDRLFTSSSEAAILRKIRECQIPSIRKINPSIPPELERIVNKALAKDKSLRYQTAAALHRDLNRFLNTQYPEFSPHDFSIFVKTAFSQTFLEQKKRLIEYSKLSVQVQEDRTLVTRTAGGRTEIVGQLSQGRDASGAGSETRVIGDSHNDGGNLDIDMSTEMKINLETLKSGGTSSPRKEYYKNEANRARSAASRSNTQTSFKKPKWSGPVAKVSAALPALLIILALGLGGYYYYSSSSSHQVVKNLGAPPVPKPAAPVRVEEPMEHTESASKAQYSVMLSSDPVGARIYINGDDTGTYTPNRRTFEANTDYSITLKKENFMNYEGTLRAKQDVSTFTMSMQPSQQAAYISINVPNGGVNTIIHVNGIRLGEKPPISRYAVPAGGIVKVTAYDPFRQMAAEQTFKIGPNQKKSVELILGNPRQPAG